MDEWRIIQDVVVLLAAALVVGLVFERLRQSAIIGHLVAGTIVGPSLLGWVVGDNVEVLAELGVALLLFTIGLELTWKRFRALGATAAVGGSLQVTLTLLAVLGVTVVLGQTWQSALVLGAIVALSSTATVLRSLMDQAELESLHGRSALGILLVQDAAVVPLVLLVTLLATGGGLREVVTGLSMAALRGIGLVFALIVVGAFLMPRLLTAAGRARNRELPTILALVSCLAATFATHAAGLSPALGAFVAGVVLAASPMATQMRAELAGFRTVFVTLFFASMGMLANLAWLFSWQNMATVLVLVVGVVLGKAAIIFFILRRLRRDRTTSIATAICLAQVGEFSFVLAASAWRGGLFSDTLFQAVITTTIVTLVLTPVLVRHAHAIGVRFGGGVDGIDSDEEATGPHVIVVGYGPAGREVIRFLQDAGHAVTVIDTNPPSVVHARSLGLRALAGNVAAPEVLEAAGIEHALAMIVTIPDHRAAAMAVEQAEALAPAIRVIARGRYHQFANVIRAAGASVVVDEEETVGRLLGYEACVAASAALGAANEEAASAPYVPPAPDDEGIGNDD